jgi:hypothetical protein
MRKAIRNLPAGHPMPFRGINYPLEIRTTMNKPQVTIAGGNLLVNFYQDHPTIPVQLPLVKWYRRQAQQYIMPRVAYWADEMGLTFNKIFIKDQDSRWGSCSSLKNLNFNWRIIMAPDGVIDYLLIHELAHLREMNHSAAFWQLVGRYDPDYRLHRQWLKDNGQALFLLLPKLPLALLNAVYFHVE